MLILGTAAPGCPPGKARSVSLTPKDEPPELPYLLPHRPPQKHKVQRLAALQLRLNRSSETPSNLVLLSPGHILAKVDSNHSMARPSLSCHLKHIKLANRRKRGRSASQQLFHRRTRRIGRPSD